jgi:hypothetical protein
MKTIYDWLAMAFFCWIVVVYLKRSVGHVVGGDRIYHYLPPSLCCAASNYFGNHGSSLGAVVFLAVAVAYFLYFVRPISMSS